MADQIESEFAEFIKWRDAQRQAEAERDFDIPLFEKTKDGTERSVTLPYSQGKKILGQWWPDLFGDKPEGDDGQGDKGKTGGGGGQPDKPRNVREFFTGRESA